METREIKERIRQMEEKHLSVIQGSLIGGAVGDALGYAVEFISWDAIRKRFGEGGIQEYELDLNAGEAIISDDTQMTLYTANALLFGFTRGALRGIMAEPECYIHRAYEDWYHCQWNMDLPENNTSWLSDVPEMHARRAPGNTCLSALHSGRMGTIEEHINNSKGCGGVMRVAPIALYFKGKQDIERVMMLGAKAAAITHGHPLAYISSAALVHIVSRAAFGGCKYEDGLRGIVRACNELLREIFGDETHMKHTERMIEILEQAAQLSLNNDADVDNIKRIGEGWIGEEALGIAVYCCLKYPDDFSKAIIASVNHSGDSDSTGAIAGNILGAWLGMEGIGRKWLNKLECRDVILEIAKDLCDECQMSEYGTYRDPDWLRKYVHCRWKE